MDPGSETLKGVNLILWEHKMDQLYFGKTKWISSLERSMKFSFKACLRKNIMPLPLCVLINEAFILELKGYTSLTFLVTASGSSQGRHET